MIYGALILAALFALAALVTVERWLVSAFMAMTSLWLAAVVALAVM